MRKLLLSVCSLGLVPLVYLAPVIRWPVQLALGTQFPQTPVGFCKYVVHFRGWAPAMQVMVP